MMNNMTTLIANPASVVSILAIGGSFMTALIAVIPLLAGTWLLLRAGGGRGLRQASTNDLGGQIGRAHV